MNLHVIAVGKIKEPGLRHCLDDYYKRIQRYARLQEIEVKDGADDDVARLIQRAVPERSVLVALEVDGQTWSSQDFARFLDRSAQQGVHGIAFAIGGSYGLPRRVSQAAALRLSLSNLTLPHRLARLLLAEQLYRAWTILRGEPYSH